MAIAIAVAAAKPSPGNPLFSGAKPSPAPSQPFFFLSRKCTPYSTPRHGPRRPSSSPPFRNGSAPETDCPVPPEQQPVNEYQTLVSPFPFSWASADLPIYASRLLVLGSSFALFLGLPVAWFGVVGADRDVLKSALAAASTGILSVTFAVLRIYLGWAYVGNRLLSATVEYEETGWYDGQIWVKTPEVLARDRLLGSFSVKPVLSRVKYTLVGLAISLFVCVILFINIESPTDKKVANGITVAGVYNDESARSFEPEAFCGEPDLS